MLLSATSPEVLARHLLLEGIRHVVPDQQVLGAMRAVPRELFVQVEDRPLAYSNRAVRGDGGGTVPEPLVVARVLSAANIRPDDRVLVIGGDGGYVVAVASRLTRDVIAVEPAECEASILQHRLQRLGLRPTVVTGPPLAGWEEEAPYDAIVVVEAQEEMPPDLVAQLGLGGRLVVPMRDADGDVLARVVREGIGRLRLDRLGSVRCGVEAVWPAITHGGE